MYSKILHPSMCLLLFSPVCIRLDELFAQFLPRGFGFGCSSIHFAYTNIPKLHERCHDMPQTLAWFRGGSTLPIHLLRKTPRTEAAGLGLGWKRRMRQAGVSNGFTRWAPYDRYEWSYNPSINGLNKWATGGYNPTYTSFNPVITGRGPPCRWQMVVSSLYFHPYLGKWSNLTI